MRTRFVALAVLAALVLAACGGGDDDSGALGSGSDSPAGATGSLDGVEDATVRIVAKGSFVDPAAGLQLNTAGSGSGFIIDPSGIAVTNNHVVTGAATLEVHVAGEDEPRNAKVLGVSECSDLAVIDIAGDDLPYLRWYEGDIDTGLDVFATGYPLGDPEFTLTRGIISKADADGESSWASVDNVVEHDARINPGNSGGPLVTEDGLVIGINYAGATETDQNFAISRAEASSILDSLQDGESVTSIGINGEAFFDEVLGGGIWVYSVESGSPADEIGVRGGDVITRFEGLAIAEDGTMADYCDVMRSHDGSDELAIEVYRYDTEQRFEGSINGEPLTEIFEFSDELTGDFDETDGVTESVTTYDYGTITDDSGAIEVSVPTAWSDVDGAVGDYGPSVEASTDLDAYRGTWAEPGVSITATTDYGVADIDTILDELGQPACSLTDGRQAYDDGLYTGSYDYYTDCDGTGTDLVFIAATPADGAFLVLVAVQMVTDADAEALDQIIASFQVVGAL